MKKILNFIWRGWMIILGTVLTFILGIPVLLLSIRKKDYKYMLINLSDFGVLACFTEWDFVMN